MQLSNLVVPEIALARSVNLERDLSRADALSEYRVTTKGIEVLSRFVSALQGERVSAWSLTGPYGMGKSSFVNYLAALCGRNGDEVAGAAYRKLAIKDKPLSEALLQAIESRSKDKGFFRIVVTSSFEPLNRSLARGIQRAAKDNPHLGKGRHKATITDRSQKLASELSPETSQLTQLIADLRRQIDVPILIIIDELGKNLEYMSHHPDKGDIFILQTLAEMTDVFLFVCLHQAFEEYSSGLTAQQRSEWSKVQGRFEDVPFSESTTEMIALLRSALKQNLAGHLKKRVEKWADKYAHALSRSNQPLKVFLNSEAIASFYPLHPFAVLALPELCRRFAQNDRTLFSFVYSKDAYSFSSFLHSHEIGDHGAPLPELGLDFLYDYFFSAATTLFVDRAESQRWIEVQDIIEQARLSFPQSQKILKTIGVLNLVGNFQGLTANRSIIKVALGDLSQDPSFIDKELSLLEERKILMYRQYANEYRLWEGSDFDLLAAMREKRALMATRHLGEVLQRTLPQTPMIASRHSFHSGTVRKFEVRWMSLTDLKTASLSPQTGFDGLTVCCFGNEKNVAGIPEICADRRPLIVCYAPFENQIKELALEAAAARAVLTDAPELVRDGVARKEARYRVHATNNQLRRYVNQLFSPNSEEGRWYTQGRGVAVRSYRELSTVMSTLCDHAYSQSPKIGMEMINYDSLSSAAAAARRALAEAMVLKPGLKGLGLEGFGPEVAIYRALFLSTGLHRETTHGGWEFVTPGESSEFFPCWRTIDKLINDLDHETLTVRDVIEELKKPPFGMKEGVILLFVVYFLMAESDRIALFREDTYVPLIDDAEIGLLLKRPELFSLKPFRSGDIHKEILEAYRAIFKEGSLPEQVNLRNPSLLAVIQPMVEFVENLPKYTKFTRAVSKEAQRLRAAIMNATDPLELLVHELPAAVGIDMGTYSDDGGLKTDLIRRLSSAFQELRESYGRLLDAIGSVMLSAFPLHPTIQALRNYLTGKASHLLYACRDNTLRHVLTAMAVQSGNDTEWLHGIAGRVLRVPVDSWTDKDLDFFSVGLHDMVDRIDHLDALVTSKGLGQTLSGDSSMVLSIMETDGKTHRQIIPSNGKEMSEARDIIAGLGPLSAHQLRALIGALLEELKGKV